MELPKDVRRKLAKLEALEAGGVDNWDGYDFSLEEYYETIGREETAESIIDDILSEIHEYIEQPAGSGCGYGISGQGYEVATKILLSRCKELECVKAGE